jgi:hypothetical protein
MLLERIEADLEHARRRRDGVAAGLLAAICADCDARSQAISPRRALTDNEVRRVVRLHARHVQYRQAERILRPYLPKSLSDADIEAIALRQHSIMSLPQIMAFLRENYSGMYDPNRAIVIVRELTS